MLELNKIYCGHALTLLKEMPDGMVDCVITSPPYWGLRDYGLEPLIWDNLNNNSNGPGSEHCEHKWMAKQTIWHGDRGKGNHKEVYCDLSKQESSSAFCSLCGAWRGSLGLEQTFQLYLDHLMQIMAESRIEVENEIKAPVTDSYKRCDTAAVSSDKYKDGRDHLVCKPNERGRNRRCVWRIPTKPFSEAHFAVFPDTLVEPMILAGCPINGIVLDPFMGSGTVAVTAIKHNRQFAGCELNPTYIEIANRRIHDEQLQLKLNI